MDIHLEEREREKKDTLFGMQDGERDCTDDDGELNVTCKIVDSVPPNSVDPSSVPL